MTMAITTTTTTDLKTLANRRFLAMNIVNQLFDLANVPIDVRQAINDQADDFVFTALSKYAHMIGDDVDA